MITAATTVWTVLGALDLIKSEFLSTEYQKLQIVSYVPTLGGKWWVIGALVILIVAIAEGAYQLIKEKDIEADSLRIALPILSIEIKEVFIIPSLRSDVFVLATVTNDSRTETLIKSYRCNLIVESQAQYHLEAHLEDISSYRRTITNHSERSHSYSYSQVPLQDFASQITRQDPLKFGLPVTGWLRFKWKLA